MSSPEDLRFALHHRHHQGAGRGAARARARTSSARCCIAIAATAIALQYARAAELLLTGHTHDLFVNHDGKCALVESGYDAHYVTCVDVAISVREDGGKRTTTWWPQFRVIDTATRDARPGGRGRGRALRGGADRQDERGDLHHRGRARFLAPRRCARARPRSATCSPTRCATACAPTPRCSTAAASAPARTTSRARASARATSWPNCRSTIAWWWSRSPAPTLRRAMENGLSLLPQPSGRFPQVSGIALQFDLARKAGERVTAMQVGGAPLIDDKTYRVAVARFPRARRRRLHHVPRRDARHAGQRRADAGERGGGLSAQARHRAHRRRGPDRGEVIELAISLSRQADRKITVHRRD